MARILTGLILLAGGLFLLVAAPDGTATGPRIGLAMALLTFGGLLVAVPLIARAIARRGVPADAGRCPVGESCTGCGAFNLKPRTACRVCDAPVNAS